MSTTKTAPRNGHVVHNDGDEILSLQEKQFLLGLVTNEMTTRSNMLQRMLDPRRDMDAELGYPAHISSKDYYDWYEREGLATRIVNLWPSEIWKVAPSVFEKMANSVTTPFEEDWEAFSAHWHPWTYLRRADEQSRIERFGGLLFGFKDGRDLSQPVAGISQDGEKEGNNKNQVIYLRVFAERHVRIESYETNESSPRFGQPTMYNVTFADVKSGGVTSSVQKPVHWTRFLHLAPNRRESEVLGAPQMENSFNRLLDIKKTLGGSAEMFWRGAFAGLSIEAPAPTAGSAATAKFTEDDRKKLRKEIDAYANGLQRYMALVGMTAKSLAPQVSDPTNHVEAQLKMIAVALNVPLRMLMGSEAGQLASGQDRKNWNDRVAGEANGYTTPFVVVPFVTRLILAGVLRAPAKNRLGYYDFKVEWPDLNAPSPTEVSEVAQRMAAALKDYMLSGARQILPPKEMFVEFFRINPKYAETLVKAGEEYLKAHPEVKEQIAGKGTAPGGAPRSSGVRSAARQTRPAAPAEASAGSRA